MASYFDAKSCTSSVEELKQRGWTIVNTSNNSLHCWHDTITSVFSLSTAEKCGGGEYRACQGHMVGYKRDEIREFLECHRLSDGQCSPTYQNLVEDYQPSLQQLYDQILEIGEIQIREISLSLGLDPHTFLDLTDMQTRGILPYPPPKQEEENVDPIPALSSSVLRVCKYDSTSFAAAATTTSSTSTTFPLTQFGAHTDTSFLTIAPMTREPGLEILDQSIDEWIAVEKDYYQPNSYIVFVGEFLQVLTKHHWKAAVHRVVAYQPSIRISCPMIIRGRDAAIINLHDPKYNHPAINEELLPDLDGTSMGTVHKLLDLKRSKCYRVHSEDDKDWVLSAYPVQSKHYPA